MSDSFNAIDLVRRDPDSHHCDCPYCGEYAFLLGREVGFPKDDPFPCARCGEPVVATL